MARSTQTGASRWATCACACAQHQGRCWRDGINKTRSARGRREKQGELPMLKFLVPGAVVAALVSAAALAPATVVAAPLLNGLESGASAGIEKVGEWNEWNG